MNWDQFASPLGVALLVLVALAFVRFGIWWRVIRTLLAPLLRPAGLLAVAVIAVLAVIKLG